MLTDVMGGGIRRALVGRADEREALLGLVRGAADGHAAVLLLSGQAGVGKTALVRDTCGRVPDDAEVLWAGCLPLSSLVVPFLPLVSAWRDRAAGRDEPAPDFDAGLVGVESWLDGLCRRRPVLLVVDDLQWADQSTLDVLMYLIAGPAERRLAVVGTFRSDDSDLSVAVRRWLADVRRLPRVEELLVGPLDRPATGQQLAGLLGRPPRESLVDDVFARTRGNAYLTALLARRLPADASVVPAGVPHELRDAVSRAWYDLSPPAREATRVIAVAARPQRAAQLAAVLDPGGDLLATLREAVDGGVLAAGADGRYWFVHPLLAEVLADGMLPEERQHWHTLFAAALTSAPDMAESAELVIDIADHHHRAGDVVRAFRWALRGAVAAEKAGGAAERTRLLRRALDLHPRVDDPEVTRPDLLHRIRAAAEESGLYEEELAAVDELLSVIDPDHQPLTVAELLVRRMHLRFLTGTEFFAVEGMHEAVRLAATQPGSPQHVLAMAELADAEIWHDLPPGPARAVEAARLARTCDSDRALTYALVAEVMAIQMAADEDTFPAGRAQAEEARQAAIRAGDFFGYVHATLWYCNCVDYVHAAPVLAHLRRCREEMVELGAPHAYVAWLSVSEADGYLLRGDPRTCRDRLRVALGASPGRHADTYSRLTAALLACWQGRTAEARAHLTRAEELFAEQSGFSTTAFDAVRAELAVAAGDAPAAVAAALTGLGQDTTPNFVERLVPLAARALADEIQRRHDVAADATAVLAELESLRLKFPAVVVELGPGLLLRRTGAAMQAWYDAEYARGRGDPGTAQAWSRVAEACGAAELGWDEAYAQWRTAEAAIPHRASRTQGTAALRRAYQLAVDLEAQPLLANIMALARSARVPVAPEPIDRTPTPGLPGLTPREREIVALIVAGRTYAEIAHSLVISEKTVSSHISHILGKTGAANRVELAELAHRTSSPTGDH
ncbi:AAA family ATPase [Actinoplanes sp. NPDC051633]|uniref:helix-turn-helix transcriptional regulator n=1 Tax=Actinoplanes sp. NPDC051633 TaxID=3155670 RepID=UPI0034424B4A